MFTIIITTHQNKGKYQTVLRAHLNHNNLLYTVNLLYFIFTHYDFSNLIVIIIRKNTRKGEVTDESLSLFTNLYAGFAQEWREPSY